MSNEVKAEITGADMRKEWAGDHCARADMLVTLRMSTEAYRRLDPTRPVYLTQEVTE